MQHSSTRTLAILTLAGAVALTGCASSSNKSKAGGLGAAATSAAAGSAASGGTVKIGFEGPLSGDNQQLGINEVNAVQVAIDEANKNNTYGFQVALEKADDVGLADKAPAAAAILQGDATVIGVVGPSFSGASKAVAPSYGAAKLVLISPSATNPDLTKQGFTAFHRVVPPDSLEGLEAADWLAKKAKNVYIVDDATDYGKGAADAVEAELKVKGITVTRDSVPQATTDYSVASQKIASSGADALFYGGYDTQAGQFAKALTAAGFKGLTMTGNGGKSSKFTAAAGPSGDGWYFSCGCLDATVAPVAAAFNTAYKAEFKTDPSTYSPEAFDATNALLTAIKAAGGAKATRAQVFDAVNALDYKGITTQIKFTSTGEVAQQVINLYLQKGGKIGLLGDIKSQS